MKSVGHRLVLSFKGAKAKKRQCTHTLSGWDELNGYQPRSLFLNHATWLLLMGHTYASYLLHSRIRLTKCPNLKYGRVLWQREKQDSAF